MNTSSSYQTGSDGNLSDRAMKQLRNARARRKLEKLRDDQALQRWITDVWDEPPEGRRVWPQEPISPQ
jgi:hypothetical protein